MVVLSVGVFSVEITIIKVVTPWECNYTFILCSNQCLFTHAMCQ